MRNKLSKIGYAVCTILLFWCIASFIEVNSKNLDFDKSPTYSSWNFFNFLESND